MARRAPRPHARGHGGRTPPDPPMAMLGRWRRPGPAGATFIPLEPGPSTLRGGVAGGFTTHANASVGPAHRHPLPAKVVQHFFHQLLRSHIQHGAAGTGWSVEAALSSPMGGCGRCAHRAACRLGAIAAVGPFSRLSGRGGLQTWRVGPRSVALRALLPAAPLLARALNWPGAGQPLHKVARQKVKLVAR